MPPFIIRGSTEWFKMTFGDDLGDWIGKNYGPIADALESVLVGDRGEYESTIAMIEESKKDEFKAKWQDRYRSSINNIGAKAAGIAQRIREVLAKEKSEVKP